jgi:hypothetical protein
MRHLALAAALIAAGPALAERACFISYAGFEEKIPHLDLDACPPGMASAEEGFCRIALAGADVLVYEFRHMDGEPCLTRVEKQPFNDFIRRLGANYPKP